MDGEMRTVEIHVNVDTMRAILDPMTRNESVTVRLCAFGPTDNVTLALTAEACPIENVKQCLKELNGGPE